MRGGPEGDELLYDSVEAYFTATPLQGRRPVYLGLLVALAAGLAALPLVRVDVTARARGLLRPSIERHRILAGSAGVVQAVYARRGTAVGAGELLASLRADDLEAQLAGTDSAATELRARAADLAQLIDLAGDLGDGRGHPRPERLRLGRYRDDAARLRHEWADLRAEAGAARAEAARAGALGRLGLEAPAEIERTRLRRARAAAAPVLLAERQRTAWAGELQEVLSGLRQAASQRAELRAQVELREIRSPVTGTVEELSPVSAGSWVATGEQIALVSPRAPLVAEVYLDSREVGRIRPGTPVRLLVDAFDHHQWGTLPGRVTEVAGDYTVIAGRPVFRVRCALLRTQLRRRGATARPARGMAVTAAFLLARRSILHLLWDSATGGPDQPPTLNEPGPA